jgi:hypothetical protein
LRNSPEVSIRIGVWAWDESEESSNWREFTNVIETLEEEGAAGRLYKTEVYFLTDNSTVEASLYKGSRTSHKLLLLVIRLFALQTKYSALVHVCHCLGIIMIVYGGDGVSRGQVNEGFMSGVFMSAYLPLYLAPVDRCPALEPWLRHWLGNQAKVFTPMDWFEQGHEKVYWTLIAEGFWIPVLGSGTYIWQHPPAAALFAIIEHRKARIKRQDSNHVFCARV